MAIHTKEQDDDECEATLTRINNMDGRAHENGAHGRHSIHIPHSAGLTILDDKLAVATTADGPRSAPPLASRRSTRQDMLHRRSSSGQAGASHFSKPIQIPAGKSDLKIEAVDRSEKDSTFHLPQDDPLSPTRRSSGDRNAKFKKQITKIAKPLVAPVTARRRKRFKDGEVVFKGHRNWEIVLSIQFGLRHTSELLQTTKSQEPDEADFRESLVFDFNPVEEHRSAVNAFAKWEHPAPFIYRLIREKFNVNEEGFLAATCSESRVRELPTPGKSGALFYITDDESYFMKTVTSHEEKRLSSILPDYYRYIRDNPHTMLTRFLAHFSVRTTKGRHIRMVVMASIFNDSLFIDRKYDLKGSTKNRIATTKELTCDNVTLKDLDLEYPIFFTPQAVEKIINQLDNDAAFLERNNVMDYSLLLGMSEMIAEEAEIYQEYDQMNDVERPYFIGHQLDVTDGKKKGYRICMGIIDTLQGFALRKKLEFAAKTVQFCSGSVMSVVPPHRYKSRFINFLKTKFLPDPHLSVSALASSSSAKALNGKTAT